MSEAEPLRALVDRLIPEERLEEALAATETVLAAAPDPAAWLQHGKVLAALDRQAEAVEAYRKVLGAPELAFEALVRMGTALGALGEPRLALQAMNGAVKLAPGSHDALIPRGYLRLKLHDFGGWTDAEARWASERFVENSRGQVAKAFVPELTLAPSAEDLVAKRVLLIGEQGPGDQIMFASMVPDLARTAAEVVLVCEPRLVRLFSASFPQIQVFEPTTAKVEVGSVDALIAMGSLGSAFRNSAADFPGEPYLRPRAEVVDRWAQRLGPKACKLRIGISWRGGVPATRRQRRSLTLGQLAPVLDIADCEFVSLQYGDVAAELAEANTGRAEPIRAFPRDEIDDFEELAGLVANLDLVISVQTTLAHLAGATGRECLTLVPRNAEWRYGAAGEAMPWYRSVRLFRQASTGDWDPVIAGVAAAVRARLAGKA